MSNEPSVYQMFRATAEAVPDAVAYRFKRDGTWHDVRWQQQHDTVRHIARALIAHGVEKGDRVCILSDTRLQWVQADFGIGTAGAVTVGIYPSSLAEDCAYIINHSGARIVIVEHAEQMAKLASVRSQIDSVERFVLIDGPSDPSSGIVSWSEFMLRADEVGEDALDERIAAIGPDDLASLVYTSGTTGVPKGAMITHNNLVFSSWSACESLPFKDDMKTLLFLPLAHVFARLIVYASVRRQVNLAFAENITAVADNLKEIRPDFIASVPRIFEKVYDKINSGARQAGGVKEKLFNWAISVGTRVSRAKQAGKPVPALLSMQYALAEKLVFTKIQAALGGRMTWAVSGAAPLSATIAEFFHTCGLLILEGLGMTENTSFTNVNRENHYKFGTVGPVGPGIEMKLADDGEILFRGKNVMKGYYRNPESTAETIDADGWLLTGDIGEIDEDGFLKITDRKKDLIITAGGKNIAPQRIEQVLRTSPYINQLMAYGDRRKFIVALATIDAEQVAAWATAHGHDTGDGSNLHEHPEVVRLIESEIERLNGNLASFETVKKVRLLPGELTVEAGELTPTLKLKRRVVTDKYMAHIEALYEE